MIPSVMVLRPFILLCVALSLILSLSNAQTIKGRNTMLTQLGDGNSMSAYNSLVRPAPGEDPVDKSFYVDWYSSVVYTRDEQHYLFTDNGQIKRIWMVNANDRTDTKVVVGPTYDVTTVDSDTNVYDNTAGNDVRMDTHVGNMVTGYDTSLGSNILYYAQGLQKGYISGRSTSWIRKAQENADGSWTVSDYVGVHQDGGGSRSSVPTTAPTSGVLDQPSNNYNPKLREAKTLLPDYSISGGATYGVYPFSDMAVNPVDNLLYLSAAYYTSSNDFSYYQYNHHEYNWKISRIRDIGGMDYIEYWAGKNQNIQCNTGDSVTTYTGFPRTSCTSSKAYVSPSEYADGLDREITVMRPRVITFDSEGNCYYYCEVAYKVRKIQASDSKVYSLFGAGYSSTSSYGVTPNTMTADTGDWNFASVYYNDEWYEAGNYPINDDYTLREVREIDLDAYGNIYIVRDSMLLVWMKEGNYAGKLKWVANMKLTTALATTALDVTYDAGTYGNELTDFRDPISSQTISSGSYGSIRGVAVKKMNHTASNATGFPLGDVLITDSNDYMLSSVQFMCPAGYRRNLLATAVEKAVYPNGTGTHREYECLACERGSYTTPENAQDACTSCALGEYMEVASASVSAEDCQPCPQGAWCPDVKTKNLCPEGTYNSITGSTTDVCIICPRGSFCPLGAPGPTLCDPNFYQDAEGQGKCVTCGAGKVSNAGAIDQIGCVNPVPNFAMGFLCLGVVVGTIFMYVSHGRFHRVAFIRKYRALNLVFFESRNVSNCLTALILKHQVPEEHFEHNWSFARFFLVFIWMSAGTVILLFVVLITYILSLSKVLFHSLLIWRGMSAPDLGFVAKMEQVGAAFQQLGAFKYVGLLMYPFIFFIEFISGFSIDLNSVEVTCVGAQAPMELLINCFVLGFIVIIIESDFQIFQNMVFEQLNTKLARALMVYPLGLPSTSDTFVKCCIAAGIATLKPMEKLLQFTMSLLNFKSFLSHHESYLAHAKTDSCDTIEGAPYVDTCLAYFTSLMFWYMMLPAVYSLASVCVPYGDNVPEEFRVKVAHKDDEKVEFVEDPILPDEERYLEAHGRVCPLKLADQLTRREFEDIVVMFDEIDVDGSGTISEDEVETLFFNMGVVASEYKTKIMFEKADVDGSGEIDFDEFCEFILIMKNEDQIGFKSFLNAFDQTARTPASGCMKLLKMSSYIAPDLTMASIGLAWLNTLVVILGGKARFLWKQVSTAPFRRETQEERSAWVRQQEDSIPTYFGLCKIVFDDFHSQLLFFFGIEDIPTLETKVIMTTSKAGDALPITTKQTKTNLKHVVRWKLLNMDKDARGVLRRDDLTQQNRLLLQATSSLVYVISFFLSYLLPLPIGHITTRVGRVMWGIVLRKYWIFLKVCLGVWTDDCVVGYNLLEENKIKIDDDINLIQMVDEKLQHDLHEEKTDEEVMATIKTPTAVAVDEDTQKDEKFTLNTERLHEGDDEWDEIEGGAMDDDGFEMDDAIEVLVGTRAIIIQIIPTFAYLSIFAVGTSHTPLFVLSDKARRFFPPLLIRNAMERAAKVEMKEANHHLTAEERGVSWINMFRAVTIYWSDSRLPQAFLNYFWFAVTVGVLYDDPFKWILLSIVISFPFLIAGLVEIYVVVGKALGIVDEDVYFLFRMTGRPVPERATEDHFNEHKHKGITQASELAVLKRNGGVSFIEIDSVEDQGQVEGLSSSFFSSFFNTGPPSAPSVDTEKVDVEMTSD